MVSILTLVPAHSKRIRELRDRYFHKDEVNLFHAENKQDLFEILEKESIDLVLIGKKNVSDEDMIDIVQTMHVRFPGTVIIVVTRQDARELAMQLYRLGLDEWIKAPYDALEISLRCRALMRRARDRFEVTTGAGVIHLPKKEFLLLHVLLSNPEKVFTKAELMERVWGYDSESDEATVAVHIGRIRKKLGDPEAFEIVAVRGVGYKAVIKVE